MNQEHMFLHVPTKPLQSNYWSTPAEPAIVQLFELDYCPQISTEIKLFPSKIANQSSYSRRSFVLRAAICTAWMTGVTRWRATSANLIGRCPPPSGS